MDKQNIDEEQIMRYFDKKFGTNVLSRFKKLREEQKELEEAESLCCGTCNEETMSHLLDEVSDVLAVITHAGHCMGYTHEQLLNMAYEKCRIRDTNPGYKHSNT